MGNHLCIEKINYVNEKNRDFFMLALIYYALIRKNFSKIYRYLQPKKPEGQTKLQYHQYYKEERRKEIIAFLGNQCIKCGFDDARALQIDHLNGGGCKELKIIKSRVTYYRDIINKHGEGYQLLCANCNWIKRVEKEETSKRFYIKNESKQLPKKCNKE